MSMEEFGDLFFVARDVRQKAFELPRHRAKHILALKPAIVFRLVGIEVIEDDMNLFFVIIRMTPFMKSKNSRKARRS